MLQLCVKVAVKTAVVASLHPAVAVLKNGQDHAVRQVSQVISPITRINSSFIISHPFEDGIDDAMPPD